MSGSRVVLAGTVDAVAAAERAAKQARGATADAAAVSTASTPAFVSDWQLLPELPATVSTGERAPVPFVSDWQLLPEPAAAPVRTARPAPAPEFVADWAILPERAAEPRPATEAAALPPPETFLG